MPERNESAPAGAAAADVVDVSVIVSFHRTPARFLEEAISSVLAQGGCRYELLLVDDAASEASREVARVASRRTPGSIRVLTAASGPNPAGLSAARNVGLEAARGRFIALLDADDVWLPGKLAAQVVALDANPETAMVYGDTLYWHSWDPDATASDFVPAAGFSPGERIDPPALLARYLDGRAAVPCTCSVLFRGDIARDVGGFEASFAFRYEDQVFWAKLAAEWPILYSGALLDRYRQHPDAMSRTDDSERAARRAFLGWLPRWLEARGVRDAGLARTIRSEAWIARHPRLGSLARRARSVARRVPGARGRL